MNNAMFGAFFGGSAEYGHLAFAIANNIIGPSPVVNKLGDSNFYKEVLTSRFKDIESFKDCDIYRFLIGIKANPIEEIFIVNTNKNFSRYEGYYRVYGSMVYLIGIDLTEFHKDSISIKDLAISMTNIITNISKVFADDPCIGVRQGMDLSYFIGFASCYTRYAPKKEIFIALNEHLPQSLRLITETNKVYENLSALVIARKATEYQIYRCMEEGINGETTNTVLQTKLVSEVQKSDT